MKNIVDFINEGNINEVKGVQQEVVNACDGASAIYTRIW